MFDPWTATLEEAIAANRDVALDLDGPLSQWDGARTVDSERDKVLAGDGLAILACIDICVTRRLVAPYWLAGAFERCFDQVADYRTGSWDDAFGKPHKGKHLSRLRKRHEVLFPVYRAVEEARAEGRPVGDELFEKIGSEYGIGKTVCTELYYEARSIIQVSPAK